MPPAFSASRAGVMPEASRDTSSGTFGNNMNPAIHTICRTLLLIASILAIPVSSHICRIGSRFSTELFDTMYGGKPMPALTQVFLYDYFPSQAAVLTPMILALALIIPGALLLRMKEGSPLKTTGILALAVFAQMIVFLQMGSTMFAIALPLMTTTFRMQ
jgi:hypothetical protein